jgi:hypothetical protein
MSGKQEVTYIQFAQKHINAVKDKPGFKSTDAMKEAGRLWRDVVKAGKHPEFVAAGHKHAPSKTRPGRQDYVTHKGDEMYNRDDHRQDDNEEGVKGKPYASKAKGKDLDVDALDLCPECKDKVSAALAKGTKKAAKKTRKAAKKGGRKGKGRKGKGGKTAKKSHKKRHEKRH